MVVRQQGVGLLQPLDPRDGGVAPSGAAPSDVLPGADHGLPLNCAEGEPEPRRRGEVRESLAPLLGPHPVLSLFREGLGDEVGARAVVGRVLAPGGGVGMACGVGVEEGLSVAVGQELPGGPADRDQTVGPDGRETDRESGTFGLPGRFPGGEDVPAGPDVQRVQQVGDTPEQMAAGVLPELVGYGSAASLGQQRAEVAGVVLVQEMRPQHDRERRGSEFGVPPVLFPQPAQGTHREGVHDPRLRQVQIAVGTPSHRLRPVPGPRGQRGAEHGVRYGVRAVEIVGVRCAERVLKTLKKRSYDAELGAYIGPFGGFQQVVGRDRPVRFTGVAPLHGLLPP